MTYKLTGWDDNNDDDKIIESNNKNYKLKEEKVQEILRDDVIDSWEDYDFIDDNEKYEIINNNINSFNYRECVNNTYLKIIYKFFGFN